MALLSSPATVTGLWVLLLILCHVENAVHMGTDRQHWSLLSKSLPRPIPHDNVVEVQHPAVGVRHGQV